MDFRSNLEVDATGLGDWREWAKVSNLRDWVNGNSAGQDMYALGKVEQIFKESEWLWKDVQRR